MKRHQELPGEPGTFRFPSVIKGDFVRLSDYNALRAQLAAYQAELPEEPTWLIDYGQERLLSYSDAVRAAYAGLKVELADALEHAAYEDGRATGLVAEVIAAESTIAELRAKLAEAEKDAERYLWLVNSLSERSLYLRFYPEANELPHGGFALYNNSTMLGYGAGVDAAIDAAREAGK